MSRKCRTVLLTLAVMAGAAGCRGKSDECRPTGLTSTGRTATTVGLSWTAPTPKGCTVTDYRIFDDGVQVATATSTTFEVQNLPSNRVHSFTVATRNGDDTSKPSDALEVKTLPDFGPNTHIYDPGMAMADIQADINAVYEPQFSDVTGQFNTTRAALLFQPGAYELKVPVGYYMQVFGLGDPPTTPPSPAS